MLIFRIRMKTKPVGTALLHMAETSDVYRSTIRDMASAVRGASWFGLFTFYFAKLRGAVVFKIPAMCLLLAVMSRTIGVGAFSPRAISD